MLTAFATTLTIVNAEYDLELQNQRDHLSGGSHKENAERSRLQVGAFIHDIKKKQNEGVSIEEEIAKLRNQITENEGKRTQVDRQVVDIIENFVNFLTDQKNLGYAEILLEFVPDDQKNIFHEKINEMIPLIGKYDGSLEEFKKLNAKLDALQDKINKVEDKNELAQLASQKEVLVKEYEQMNIKNQQISMQQTARNDGLQANTEALSSARLKESQLERELSDLMMKIQANNQILKTDDINRKQTKVLGSSITVLTPQEKSKRLAENKSHNTSVKNKSSELDGVKKDITRLVGELKRTGEQKTAFLHDSLSKKLDEINEIQTRINKLKNMLKALRVQEVKLRKSQEEKESKLVPLKDELIEAFQEIINMLRGLPTTKNNADLGVAKQLIQQTIEKFPPTHTEEGLSDFSPTPEISLINDDLVSPQSLLGSVDQNVIIENSESVMPIAQNKVLDVVDIKPALQTPISFMNDMNKLKLASKSNAIIHLDAQKRCISACKIIVKSPEVDQRNLLNFLKDNKAFMGITYRAVASGTISKVMKTIPLSSNEAMEKKLVNALCY